MRLPAVAKTAAESALCENTREGPPGLKMTAKYRMPARDASA